jgi:hypothetical protein
MPVMCMFYALLGDNSGPVPGAHGFIQLSNALSVCSSVEITLLVVNLLIVLLFLLGSINTGSAGRESFDLLVKGPYSLPFFALAIGVGLVFTLLMSLAAGTHPGAGTVALMTVADLVGHYFIFFLLLKVGVSSRSGFLKYNGSGRIGMLQLIIEGRGARGPDGGNLHDLFFRRKARPGLCHLRRSPSRDTGQLLAARG